MNPQQAELFAEHQPIVRIKRQKDESLDEQFTRWIEANPHILKAFIEFALQVKYMGRKKTSAKLLIERLRWEYHIKSNSEDFAISNSYTSRLVRLAVKREPRLEGLFDFHELTSQRR